VSARAAETATRHWSRREQTPSARRWLLNRNTPSIESYRAAGAVPMDEWTVFRLTDEAFTSFAEDRRNR
jgi:hypothetical protein